MITSKRTTIDAGSDAGKVFEITMPDAYRGEAILMKILTLISDNTTNKKDIFQLTSTDEGVRLWDSLIDFVKIVPVDIPRNIDKDDITSPMTLINLKTEVFNMILGFTSN